MTAGQLDLFAMNAHGDIWQELELGATVEPFTVAGAGRVHVLEEWTRSDGPGPDGRIRITAECRGCPTRDPEMCATFIGRGASESECWQEIERRHQQHLAKGE